MAGVEVETQFFNSYEEWHAVRDEIPGRFSTGQLPAMEYEDGNIVPESGALKRCIAAATGRLGSGRDYAISEALLGISDDLKKLLNTTAPNLMNLGMMGGGPNTWTSEHTTKCEETRPKIAEAIAKGAKLLQDVSRFTSSGETCGEVDYFWTLHLVEIVHPGTLGDLQPFYDRLRANEGIAKYVEGTSMYCTPKTPVWVQPIPK